MLLALALPIVLVATSSNDGGTAGAPHIYSAGCDAAVAHVIKDVVSVVESARANVKGKGRVRRTRIDYVEHALAEFVEGLGHIPGADGCRGRLRGVWFHRSMFFRAYAGDLVDLNDARREVLMGLEQVLALEPRGEELQTALFRYASILRDVGRVDDADAAFAACAAVLPNGRVAVDALEERYSLAWDRDRSAGVVGVSPATAAAGDAYFAAADAPGASVNLKLLDRKRVVYAWGLLRAGDPRGCAWLKAWAAGEGDIAKDARQHLSVLPDEPALCP